MEKAETGSARIFFRVESQAVRQRHRAARPRGGGSQSRRRRRRALGGAGASRRPGAKRPGGQRGDGDEPALRRAHGKRTGASALLPEAGRRVEEEILRLALLCVYRRPAAAQADSPRTLGPYAALERSTRVPAV